MKTKILSVSLMFVVISGILNSTYAATANNTGYTILNNIKAINKIEIRGNVELFISDNPTEQVKVYNKYYSETALVQSSNGVLRISSYTPEKLIVWVTSENLRSVSAYDNAEVRSFGDVSKIEFSIDLHDYATAKLRFDSYSADVTLNDHSKIEVSGTVTEFHVNRNASS
ncbi:MAG: GIN domain-containing protein, partial [Mucilaginibacter sp.]